MNYYPHHIGDYRAATAHLTNAQDLAYRRLVEMYYDTEQPISLDLERVSRRLRVEQSDVLAVLDDFFFCTVDGWRHVRCEAELEKYKRMSAGGKAGAEKRWGKTAEAPQDQPIDSPPMAPPSPPQSLPNSNQEPITINQEKTEDKGKKPKVAAAPEFVLPDWVDAEAWNTWHGWPKRKKATHNAKMLALKKLAKWRDAGLDHAGALEAAAEAGWQGLFMPEQRSQQPQRRQDVETAYARKMRETYEVIAPNVAAANPNLTRGVVIDLHPTERLERIANQQKLELNHG